MPLRDEHKRPCAKVWADGTFDKGGDAILHTCMSDAGHMATGEQSHECPCGKSTR